MIIKTLLKIVPSVAIAACISHVAVADNPIKKITNVKTDKTSIIVSDSKKIKKPELLNIGKLPGVRKPKKYQTHGMVFFDLSQNPKTISPKKDRPVLKLNQLFDRKVLAKTIELNPQVRELASFSRTVKKDQVLWAREFSPEKRITQPKGTKALMRRIAVPDITVELRKPDYKTTIASATTELSGHYRIPRVLEGKYALCWKGPRWKEECFKELIEIKNHTHYASIIYIKPGVQNDRFTPLTGKVRMADGQLCRRLDINHALDLSASVQLNKNNAPLSTIRANSQGQYVFPMAPRKTNTSVIAHCPDGQSARVKSRLQAQKKQLDSGQLLVTGNIAAFDGIKAASSKVAIGFQKRQDLTLLGKQPKVIGFGVKNADGSYVTKAKAGSTVQLTSPVKAKSKLVRFWHVQGGTLKTTSQAHTVEWQLPKTDGQYAAQVSVADGRGGWTSKKVIFHVTDDERLSFSGTVRTSNGASISSASPVVQINGQSININSAGYFRDRIKPSEDGRYTLSITASGYMPFSQVYHRATSGGSYVIEPVETRSFSAEENATVSFHIPNVKKRLRECQQSQTDKRCNFESRASVKLHPGSLVNEKGDVYNGQVTAQGAYIDPSLFSMPGDYDGLTQSGRNQSLISYGAMYVSFTDNSGGKLQLGKDQLAEITIPVPADRDLSKAPPTIPLWYYNYDTGFWEEEGVGTLTGNVYKAQVKHFSTINMDIGDEGNSVCARVEVDFLNTPEDRILHVTMTLPDGGTQIKQATLDDTLNAVYRILPNETVTFDVLRSDGTDYPEAIYKNEEGDVIVDGEVTFTDDDLMVGVDLWPDEPFADCIPYVLLTGEIEVPVFHTRKDANNTDTVDVYTGASPVADDPGEVEEGQLAAEAYYELMDPNDERLTLGDWLKHNGFIPDDANVAGNAPDGNGFVFEPGAQVVELSYLNHGDLGSGRRMHCRKDEEKVACVVGNYAVDDDVLGNGFNRDPAAAEVAFEANMGTGFATVAMEYSDTEGVDLADSKLVKFFTYANADGDEEGIQERIYKAALDRVSDPGDRWHPNVCMVCHGGDFPEDSTGAGGDADTLTDIFPENAFPLTEEVISDALADGKPLGAVAIENASDDHREAMVAFFRDNPSSFREFDLDAIINLQGTNPDSSAKQLNCNYVQPTLPAGSEIQDVLDAWYGPECTAAGSPTQNTYIPDDWDGNNTVYTEVAGKVCRTCHIAQTGFEFTDESGLWSLYGMNNPGGEPYSCGDMPQAAVTYHAYWMENLHQILIDEYGVAECSD